MVSLRSAPLEIGMITSTSNHRTQQSLPNRSDESLLIGCRILIIDDDPAIRLILQEFLEGYGAQCQMVENPVDAFALLDRFSFDAILSDIYMPNMTGSDMLPIITHKQPLTPIILMTGRPSLETSVSALRSGAFDYLIKPFNLENVQMTIERALKYRRLNLENQRYQKYLEEEVQKRTRELSEFLFHSVQSLMQALEARDPYTQGHGDRVSRVVIDIASELGVEENEYETLRLASQLHDIGKIGIPDSILLKPGKLTEEEYTTMKDHVVIGYQILAPIPHLQEVSTYVYEHHERMDGKGYPRGLTGEQIHFNSRILCVAEVLDALATKRCYKPAWSKSEIEDYFIENRGGAYDPDAVDALISVLHRDGQEYLQQFQV